MTSQPSLVLALPDLTPLPTFFLALPDQPRLHFLALPHQPSSHVLALPDQPLLSVLALPDGPPLPVLLYDQPTFSVPTIPDYPLLPLLDHLPLPVFFYLTSPHYLSCPTDLQYLSSLYLVSPFLSICAVPYPSLPDSCRLFYLSRFQYLSWLNLISCLTSTFPCFT
jgi:hypothetical protein